VIVIVDMVQLMIFFICHPSWDIRRMASDGTRKIIAAAPQLSEDLLLEFTNFLSVVGERLCNSNTRCILYSLTLLILLLFVVLNIFSFSPLSERCTYVHA
jgi:hypothetical protein